jgi:biotin carboxyl carrier protein
MDAAREAIKDISSDEEDVLTYAMYPTTGLRFLRIKHGLEPVPDEMKPKDADGAKPARAPQGSAVQPVGRGTGEAPPKSANVRQFNVYVGDEFFRVEVDAAQPESAIGAASPAVGGAPGGGDEPSISTDESPIVAPLPGIVLRYEVEVGVQVQAGDPVVVLEAMKMENTLPSPVAGTVRALSLEPGATVAKDDILAIIAP